MNDLTPAELERVGKFVEETSEANQVVGKILLHGWAPFAEGIQYDNRRDFEREVADTLAAIDLLLAGGDLNFQRVQALRAAKRKCITRYMVHQPFTEVPTPLPPLPQKRVLDD